MRYVGAERWCGTLVRNVVDEKYMLMLLSRRYDVFIPGNDWASHILIVQGIMCVISLEFPWTLIDMQLVICF